ncbi:helix-turn-helix domain-containing protein [Robertkochia solimangrovi]|uniref:helix-turn-helix domain-containing protein n=1 Tax=Robertkochia solimangrovi TaxID=2213046 RepID=UPI00117F8D3D|nr:helix-turn-helix domain-containing protein [Robertkochia solimangrovi]TRZ42471.1 AraC family transcriptional regulator [Robertkochia solimangrovi]
MDTVENIEEFYKRSPYAEKTFIKDEQVGDFAVFPRSYCPLTSPFSRRSFYKVALVLDPGKLFYANRWIEINQPALQFSNPMVPYAWETQSTNQQGWFCLFTESFLQSGSRIGSLSESPFFKTGGTPILYLNSDQQNIIADIYQKMIDEFNGEYEHKYDALRTYLHLLMHEAIKLQPANDYGLHQNAASRIVALFMELVERQFPVHFSQGPLLLKYPKDYADQLSIHVNSLNRSLKQVTGKTTSQILAERIANEALIMLEHTNWNISEIAFSLGFEEANNFTSFFKRVTNRTPSDVRKA